MSNLQLDTNYQSGNYSKDLMNFLMPVESAQLASGNLSFLSPKYDGNKSIALGYGLDLLNNSISAINTWLSAANLTLSASDIALINQAKANRTPANLTMIASQLQLALPSEPAAEAVLRKILVDKETGLTQLLSNNGITIGDSLERIALMSLFFNSAPIYSNGQVVGDNLIGPKLLNALATGNRAEAWYEIRYASNGGSSQSQGIANRRYNEANEFGLYVNPGSATYQEALQVYQMYTVNSATMIVYDAKYSPLPSLSLSTQLQHAETELSSVYGNGTTFDLNNIFDTSAPGPQSVVTVAPVTGTAINRSTDTGADLLIGGAGNDTLIGGSASDTYVYMAPASSTTTETINDSFGNGVGSIYMNQGSYKSMGSDSIDLQRFQC